ncbi:MAG: carboxypeptidase regulatory-like domain-containing protein [Gemmatimonadetes bacterium]|nr:carboxypeptidase regulatory-like domain-containing protein [Gemmatimonadota bacterium]
MQHHSSTTRTLVAALMAGVIAACGGGDAGQTGGEPAGGEAQQPAAVENAGTISGTINFAGEPPAGSSIDMSAEATCAAKHASTPMTEEVVASGGKLANVFVYIKEGLSGTFPASPTPVEVNQDGCVYHPHVLGVQAGQTLAIRNSDGLLHNIKAAPTNNRTFNISQPTNMVSRQTFSQPEIMIPVQCDVHGWMSMYIGVTPHPYFAVSGSDGNFTIGNVPPGTYTIESWHEKYGVMTQQVTVDPNGTATVSIDYSASMAGAHVPLGAPFDPHDHGAARAGTRAAAH